MLLVEQRRGAPGKCDTDEADTLVQCLQRITTQQTLKETLNPYSCKSEHSHPPQQKIPPFSRCATRVSIVYDKRCVKTHRLAVVPLVHNPRPSQATVECQCLPPC